MTLKMGNHKFTCFSMSDVASSRIWSSSWVARSLAFTAAAEIAVIAARFILSMLRSCLVSEES